MIELIAIPNYKARCASCGAGNPTSKELMGLVAVPNNESSSQSMLILCVAVCLPRVSAVTQPLVKLPVRNQPPKQSAVATAHSAAARCVAVAVGCW